MDGNGRLTAIAAVMARYRTGRLTRRRALGLLTGLGLTATGAVALLGRGGAEVRAGGVGAHAGHGHFRHQEGTPVEEAPPATPVLGERPDGTRVWRVQVAAFSEADLAEAMAFFPEQITVNVGDSIFFDNRSFHTVTFLSGGPVPPLLLPPSAIGTPPAGPVGTPVAGQPAVLYNPEAAFPAGGDSYDGTGYVNSGVPVDPSAPPFVLTFTQPGTYDYLCLVHPKVMKGTVVVQEAGAAPPQDQAAIDQTISERSAAILGQAADLVARYATPSPAAGSGPTVHEVAVGVGEGQLEVFRFVPDALTVKAGDTVRWTYRGIQDPHTVTFLGGGAPPEDLLVIPQEGGPPIFATNAATYLPAGESVYRGQGYANSGYLWPDDPADPRLAGLGMAARQTYELTFEAAGEQPYYCVIHGDPVAREGMVATITVA
jgi:plastocyanin